MITERDKVNARAKANYRVKTGDLPRATECESCGNAGKLQKHHPDYSRPLFVRWLCRPCHGKEHGHAGINCKKRTISMSRQLLRLARLRMKELGFEKFSHYIAYLIRRALEENWQL